MNTLNQKVSIAERLVIASEIVQRILCSNDDDLPD